MDNKKKAFLFGIDIVIFILIVIGFISLSVYTKNLPAIRVVQNSESTAIEQQDLYITMPIEKGWYDSGFHANQYSATLYNNTFSSLRDWSVTLEIPNNAKITDSWNISFIENDDGTITIYNTPNQGFNDIIEPNNFITFGFILFANSDNELTNFVIRAVPNAKITDYPLYYVLVFLSIVFVTAISIQIAIAIKDRQFKHRRELDKKIIIQSMKTFTNFIDTKDPYTRGHSIRVAFYTKKIAQKMDFDEEELYNIYYVALLHDVGKINIPDEILNKPGKLTQEEMDIIKTHTSNGASMLKDFSSIPCIVEGAHYHHERYDGNGYPVGLKGEEIPLIARIIGVADAFDAMNSDRCYRKALSKDKIISELKEGLGKQFDPEIVKIMLDLIENDAFKNMNSELN